MKLKRCRLAAVSFPPAWVDLFTLQFMKCKRDEQQLHRGR
jgi:hypothetical protein